MSDPRDMSGVWYGRYFDDFQQGSFIALLEEAGEGFSGSISEPDGQGGVRTATVTGWRSGGAIRFVKQYRGRWNHAVLYAGSVDDRGTEANGSWEIADDTAGGFVMQREKFSVEELDEEIEEGLEVR